MASKEFAFRRDASGTVGEMLPFPAIYEGQRVPWYASKTFVGLVIGGKFASSAPDRFAVARRGSNSETISAPTLQLRRRIAFCIFFSRIVCSANWFSFLRLCCSLARD